MTNYKKINVFIILLFLVFTPNSFSEVVKKVEVKGNQRISNETIVIFGDITLGKNYEASDVNQLIKKLYDTTFISDILVEIKNNKLSITVKENPIVNSIIFDGEKANKFKLDGIFTDNPYINK